MSQSFRYHPIIEGLRVNEDGSEIYLNDRKIPVHEYSNGLLFTLFSRQITVMRIVCECWHGLAENTDYIVKKVDETKDNHYSNLTWSKRGQGISHSNSDNFCRPAQWTKEEFLEVKEQRLEGENILDFFKRCKVNKKTYYIYNRKYGKKEK